jgi:prevent-host-death family protein
MAADDLEGVNMHEAKTHLSKLVQRVEDGAEIVIKRAGKPAAKLVPIERPRPGKRVLGTLRGKIELPSDEEWAEMDREIERDFEESEVFPTGDRLWRGD